MEGCGLRLGHHSTSACGCHLVYDDKGGCQETRCTHECVALPRADKEPERGGCRPPVQSRAFPFMRRVLLLLLLFLTSLITEGSQRCCNQFLSFHQSCIRLLRATTIVSANSHRADYWWEAGGLFNRSAKTSATR